jgi:ketosteroid isomerase-like protein
MSQENVDVVRRYYEAADRWLEAYWADPLLPFQDTPELRDAFDLLDEDAEWDWLFGLETLRGHEQIKRAIADWIETVDYWRIGVDEVIDGSADRVLAVLSVEARGRGSGAPADQRVFAVVTVRDGKLVRVHDHTERGRGLEAAGLGEAGG